jgi:flagellar basal body P-ring formation protein FlgA
MIASSRQPFVTVALVVGAMLMTRASVAQAQQSTPPQPDGVAVAARAIPRGTVLTEDDITYVVGPASPQPVAAAANQVQPGWVARRLVKPGEPLRAPAVAPPIVLTANQTVDVLYADHDIQITIRGVVTKDAALGERVTVRTSDGHHLDGVVTGPRSVRIE